MNVAAADRELPGYDFYVRVARTMAGVRRPVRGVPVLLYHSIAEDDSPENAWRFNVAPATFARQMDWLRDQGFQPVGPDRWLAWNQEGQPLPPRPVMITFDDGYRNNLATAVSILKQHGFRAAFFVSTGFSGAAQAFPWVRGARNPAEFAPMSEDEVRTLEREGMDVGAHTREHPRLAAIPDAQARAEIAASKADLERWLGHPVGAFAYPYGSEWDVEDRHRTFCREAGFSTAFTTRPRVSRAGDSPMAIPRITVLERDGVNVFALKVRGFFEGYETFRKILRRLRRGRTD